MDTLELEACINKITSNNDNIAFRDNVPIGYLFMNGRICDIQTWDCMHYTNVHKRTRRLKNQEADLRSSFVPKQLLNYYKRSNRIPEKIIYIDFGRDKCLSIDDPRFAYNKFLSAHYHKIDDFRLNPTYKRIVVYRRLD